MNAFGVVKAFEESVAKFSGAKYAVAVNTGTSALFLSMVYACRGRVILPARTFISVPMAARHAGLEVEFVDDSWSGVYRIEPDIIDGALRFRRGMYQGGLHCLSFQARKILNIGEGGMVLTDDPKAAKWLRCARYSGRDEEDGFSVEEVSMLGWQLCMSPEKAARGLHLMEYIGDGEEDQVLEYPDLRNAKVFKCQRPLPKIVTSPLSGLST